eukprot:TRINITY_DN19430_c0_g1_i1.p1 TRINITY_DN19430_c0_g1~~TRINITY_DN19430_c0_g1_i1.p1  ORF type:complete len:997 (+),score=345.86 TRINITY_DN19430_c0_g1_i1:64-3054(+)
MAARPPSPPTTADGTEADDGDGDADFLPCTGIASDIAMVTTVLREMCGGGVSMRQAAEMMSEAVQPWVPTSPSAAPAAPPVPEEEPPALPAVLGPVCALLAAAAQQLDDKDAQLRRAVEFGNALIEKTKVQAEDYREKELQMQAARNALQAEVAMWKGWDGNVLTEGEATQAEGDMLQVKRHLQGKVGELQLRLQGEILKKAAQEEALQELREENAGMHDEYQAVANVNERMAEEAAAMRVTRQKLEVSLHILETKMGACGKCQHTPFNALPIYDTAMWERHAGGSEYAVMESFLNTPSQGPAAQEAPPKHGSRPPSPLSLHLTRVGSSNSIPSSPAPVAALPARGGGLNSLFGKSPKPLGALTPHAAGADVSFSSGAPRPSTPVARTPKPEAGVARDEYYRVLGDVNKLSDAQAKLEQTLAEAEEEKAALKARCDELERAVNAAPAPASEGGDGPSRRGSVSPSQIHSPPSPASEDLATQLHWHELHEEIEALSVELVREKSIRMHAEAAHTVEMADLRASFIQKIQTPRGARQDAGAKGQTRASVAPLTDAASADILEASVGSVADRATPPTGRKQRTARKRSEPHDAAPTVSPTVSEGSGFVGNASLCSSAALSTSPKTAVLQQRRKAGGRGGGGGMGIPLLPLGDIAHSAPPTDDGRGSALTARERTTQLGELRRWLAEAESRMKELGTRNQRLYASLQTAEARLQAKDLEVERLAGVVAEGDVAAAGAAAQLQKLKGGLKAAVAEEKAMACDLAAKAEEAATLRDVAAALKEELRAAEDDNADLRLRFKEGEAERQSRTERAPLAAPPPDLAPFLADASRQLRAVASGISLSSDTVGDAARVLERLYCEPGAAGQYKRGSPTVSDMERQARSKESFDAAAPPDAAAGASAATVCTALPQLLLSQALLHEFRTLGDRCVADLLRAYATHRALATAGRQRRQSQQAKAAPPAPHWNGLSVVGRGWALLGALISLLVSVMYNYFFVGHACPPEP